ncbi:MAG: hypothetical protein HFH84_11705 [Lachnospiraceae bacterium]|nr:hypothetical protein [Lachnospiraceae bacterium]
MMMTALIHRDPDQGKSWLSQKAALGFRRLSIIDLEGSVQPMANETGDLVLVFNGEIYNYQELRQELLEAGHIFSTQGDSEVLLHGYEEWGVHLPEHLRGMFAFAIWDEKNEALYAARDPFGIKPFYYALTDDCFVFASEIKGILPHPSYKKKLNPEALEQYLSFQYSAKNQHGKLGLPPGPGNRRLCENAYDSGRGSRRLSVRRSGLQPGGGRVYRKQNLHRGIRQRPDPL